MKKLPLLVTLSFLLMITDAPFAVPQAAGDAALPQPPVAKKLPKVDVLHGDRRVDDYYWLREKSNPEVISYLEAENAFTAAVLKPTEAFQESLYKEMLARIKQTDLSVPVRDHGFLYYSRTVEGKQYPIYCRKTLAPDAPEQILLDLNDLATGQKFMDLGAYTVSSDGNLLAYSTDNTGFRQYTLRVKDLRTDQLLPDRIEKTVSVAWAADNKTLFYIVEDHAKRPYRLYRHALGSTDPDPLIYEEKDEKFSLDVERSRSRAYLFLASESLTASEVRFLPAATPDAAWKLIAPREKDHEYEVDHRGDRFFIRTNSGGRNFRLVSAPAADPRRENWQEVIPHRPNVMLAGMDFFADFYALFEREDGLPRLRITSFRDTQSHRIEFPEPTYSASPGQNPEYDTKTFRFNYQSFITPSSVFDYDMDKRTRTLLKQTEVLGGYDPSQYQSERLWATASDGARIPISIVYRKGLKRDGSAPLLLYGYGSYGASMSATFSSNRLSLLDRGVTFAIAHIRGGGELGKPWHDQGRMMHKRNTFTDFIASAEFLIAQKFTAKDRLAITGGSAGGLLMGAVTNMRPDLFKAVVSLVPFVDVLNTMADSSLPLTVAEFEEWGNSANKAEYDYMKTYCPYTNLEKKPYPAILVRTSLNDSQVMYWEPAKYVAKLRSLKTDTNPLLFKTNMAAGHGGSSGRYDYLREVAFDYSFLLSQFGLTK
ncbi:MAG TPA: S9 family peptidase [Candidatus Acidoferrales bacterium]|nr:S9 family peptidase [Candidatus Acidoferrales bacterium]